MKNILVTGACGYLGARLSMHLAEKGYRVTAFDSNKPTGYDHWNSLMEEVIIADIRDEKIILDLAEKRFDVAIHLISLDHHKSEDSPNFVSSINVMPTWNLLDNLTKTGLEKFIYFSTIHVYGNIPKEIITDDRIPKPINAYGLTHFLSENICNYFNMKTDTNCINVRLSNSYGSPVFKENNCWWLVINDLCKFVKEEQEIKLLSDGSPQRDFIHSTDILRAIEIIINIDGNNVKNNTFHISSQNTQTIWELAQIVKKVYKERYKIDIDISLSENENPIDDSIILTPNKYTISNASLKSLGFNPVTELETGINEIFDYLDKAYV